MELRQLRYFLAVAEEESFTAGAGRVGIAQPSLSRQIRQLERLLGVELFVRSARGATLTAAGRALLEPARALLADADRALVTARRAGTGSAARLDVATLAYDVPSTAATMLRDFARRAPEVEVTRVTGTTGERINRLRAGELDVAFVRLSSLDDDVLCFRRLVVEPLAVVLPEEHPLARRSHVAVAALRGESLAFYPREHNPRWHDEVFATLSGAGVRPRRVHEGSSIFELLPLVAAEQAVALISASMARLVAYPGVVYRPLTPQAPTLGLGVAWHRDNPNPALRRFLAAV